jgi:hypothetical protein
MAAEQSRWSMAGTFPDHGIFSSDNTPRRKTCRSVPSRTVTIVDETFESGFQANLRDSTNPQDQYPGATYQKYDKKRRQEVYGQCDLGQSPS